MWSYYGSKTNLARLYPKPKHKQIIEPFAGTARYSLIHFENDVLLIDKYPVIIKIWKWLQQCSKNDILKLPRLGPGETLNDFSFDCEEAKMLMGFLIAKGIERPRIKPTDRAIIHRPNTVNYSLKRIAANLFKIKHWQFIEGDYSMAPSIEATWFIDPPYQFGGSAYVMSSKKINFKHLAEWSLSRKGQIIVCENTKATWLPFRPMVKQKGSILTTTEAIWSNMETVFDVEQLKLIA